MLRSKATSRVVPSPTPAHSRRIDKKKFTHVSAQVVAQGEHLALYKYKYVDASGGEKAWEVAQRRERPKNADADVVCSIPVLRRQLKYDCLVLVKQYRPATKAFTLEFPSGVMEKLEASSQHAALRRLNSQTGYTSTGLNRASPATASDPIHTNCTTKLMSVDVNGDDLRNENARQDFGEGELYEVVQIPINDVLERLDEYSGDGYVVDSRVYAFALGLSMGIEMGECTSEKEESDVHFVTNIIDP